MGKYPILWTSTKVHPNTSKWAVGRFAPVVSVADLTVAVQSIGFKRRPLYAPLKPRALRIGNWLYLRLATPVMDGQTVEVKIRPALSGRQMFAVASEPSRTFSI